jgi:hypothetical protein
MEPKHERCVECGCPVDLHEPDPEAAQLEELFARPIAMIAEATVKRTQLPSSGTLTAFENGLLFLPDVRQLPSGGISAVEPVAGPSSETSQPGFWTLLMRRNSDSLAQPSEIVRPEITLEAASERFLDSPGGLFIRREAIVHAHYRGNMLRIERKPGRTVVFRINSPAQTVKAGLLKCKSSGNWQSLRMTLSG